MSQVRATHDTGGRMYPDSDKIRHFIAKKGSRPVEGEHRYVEVRYDDATRTDVDEICTTQLHLERMSDNQIWMEINGVHVWITTPRARVRVTCFPDTAEPVEVGA